MINPVIILQRTVLMVGVSFLVGGQNSAFSNEVMQNSQMDAFRMEQAVTRDCHNKDFNDHMDVFFCELEKADITEKKSERQKKSKQDHVNYEDPFYALGSDIADDLLPWLRYPSDMMSNIQFVSITEKD